MAPTITSIYPSYGPQKGGTAVEIEGSGLDTATGVTFGTNDATGVTPVDGSTLAATTPPGTAPGPVDVTVTDGTNADTLPEGFNYLEAAVEHALAYELLLEVDMADAGTSTPEWTKVRFTSEINPTFEPTMQDATTYDDEGQHRDVKTGSTWSCEFTINRYRDAQGKFMPEAEKLRKAGDPESFGEDAFVHVRWYDKLGADEAYEGQAYVQWARAETGAEALGKATVTLTGYGVAAAIENPAAAA